MPLIKSKSKKAFEHNIKAEMDAGKPQPQSLAIAYSVKRRAKKAHGGPAMGDDRMGLAEGGMAEISAKSEKRPMPRDLHADSHEEMRSAHKKALQESSWTDKPTERQAIRPSRVPLSQPKMVESGVIRTTLRKHEHDLMGMDAPASPKEQPERDMDEADAKKMGKSPDMSKPHTTRKAYAKGGKINDLVSMDRAEEDEVEHPAGLEEDDDQETMPVDEYMSTRRAAPMLAEGGHIEEDEDNYADDGDHDSIASAIMSRRNRLHAEIDSGAHDEDLAAMDEDSDTDGEPAGRSMYAEGGEVDLSINHDEEPNNEDQMSFQALKKENYNSSNLDMDQPEDSNLKGDEREEDEENEHDMISSIRSKMAAKRQFSRR